MNQFRQETCSLCGIEAPIFRLVHDPKLQAWVCVKEKACLSLRILLQQERAEVAEGLLVCLYAASGDLLGAVEAGADGDCIKSAAAELSRELTRVKEKMGYEKAADDDSGSESEA